MTRIALDFETHYTGEYSVKKLGHALYARDPRFRCTMAAAWSPTLKVSTTPDRFPWDALDGAEIVAHNAAFDRAVFRRERGHDGENGGAHSGQLADKGRCEGNRVGHGAQGLSVGG